MSGDTRLSYSCIVRQWLEHVSQRLTHERHLITNTEIPPYRAAIDVVRESPVSRAVGGGRLRAI